jgi:hypothetical protein
MDSSPISSAGKIKHDTVKSGERVAELKSIVRDSSVGEIASKFRGQSLAESRVGFEQKQNKIKQRERLLRRALYYFQLNKLKEQKAASLETNENSAKPPDASANVKTEEFIPPLPDVQAFWKATDLATKSNDSLPSPLPRRSTSPAPQAPNVYSPVRFVSSGPAPLLSVSKKAVPTQVTPDGNNNRCLSPVPRRRSVSPVPFMSQERAVSPFPPTLSRMNSFTADKFTMKDLEEALENSGISKDTVKPEDWEIWQTAIASAVEDQRNGAIPADLSLSRLSSQSQDAAADQDQDHDHREDVHVFRANSLSPDHHNDNDNDDVIPILNEQNLIFTPTKLTFPILEEPGGSANETENSSPYESRKEVTQGKEEGLFSESFGGEEKKENKNEEKTEENEEKDNNHNENEEEDKNHNEIPTAVQKDDSASLLEIREDNTKDESVIVQTEKQEEREEREESNAGDHSERSTNVLSEIVEGEPELSHELEPNVEESENVLIDKEVENNEGLRTSEPEAAEQKITPEKAPVISAERTQSLEDEAKAREEILPRVESDEQDEDDDEEDFSQLDQLPTDDVPSTKKSSTITEPTNNVPVETILIFDKSISSPARPIFASTGEPSPEELISQSVSGSISQNPLRETKEGPKKQKKEEEKLEFVSLVFEKQMSNSLPAAPIHAAATTGFSRSQESSQANQTKPEITSRSHVSLPPLSVEAIPQNVKQTDPEDLTPSKMDSAQKKQYFERQRAIADSDDEIEEISENHESGMESNNQQFPSPARTQQPLSSENLIASVNKAKSLKESVLSSSSSSSSAASSPISSPVGKTPSRRPTFLKEVGTPEQKTFVQSFSAAMDSDDELLEIDQKNRKHHVTKPKEEENNEDDDEDFSQLDNESTSNATSNFTNFPASNSVTNSTVSKSRPEVKAQSTAQSVPQSFPKEDKLVESTAQGVAATADDESRNSSSSYLTMLAFGLLFVLIFFILSYYSSFGNGESTTPSDQSIPIPSKEL